MNTKSSESLRTCEMHDTKDIIHGAANLSFNSCSVSNRPSLCEMLLILISKATKQTFWCKEILFSLYTWKTEAKQVRIWLQ